MATAAVFTVSVARAQELAIVQGCLQGPDNTHFHGEKTTSSKIQPRPFGLRISYPQA